MDLVPRQFRDQPLAVREILLAAAQGDPGLTDNPAWRAAYEAQTKAQAGRDLQSRVAALCADPAVRAAAGDRFDEFVQHPERAYAALIELSTTNPRAFRSPAMQEALQVVAEVREFQAAHGIAEPAAPAPPLPSDTRQLDAEYQALIGKLAAAGELSEGEQGRLQALAAIRVEREAVAETAALHQPAGPRDGNGRFLGAGDEYSRLIGKNLHGGLNLGERARLEELATARLIESGELDPVDAEIEQSDNQEDINE